MPTKVNHGNLWHLHLMTWPFPAKFGMKVKSTKCFCFIIKEDDIDFFKLSTMQSKLYLVSATKQWFSRVHLHQDTAQTPHVYCQVVGDTQ